jgi:hypothetical protein
MRGLLDFIGAIVLIFGGVLGAVALFADTGVDTAQASPDAAIHWPADTPLSADEQHEAARVILAACPGLAKYQQDLTWKSAQVEDAYFYQQDEYGWKRALYVDIKVADNPHRIPDKARAWGHTLHYAFGGGPHPGVLGKKPQSRAVCDGRKAASGADWFKPAAALAFLDSSQGK